MAGPEYEHISEVEYRRWLTPRQVLARCPNPHSEKSNAMALMKRALLGRVRTAVEMVQTAQQGHVGNEEFVILPSGYWGGGCPIWPDHFWSTGDYHTILKTSPQLYIDMTGVRFEPEGVEKLCQQLSDELPKDEPEEQPTANRRDLPPLPEKLLRKWHTLFVEAYPNGSVTLAAKSVEGMFPDRWVSRKRLRELFPDVSAGRPRKTTT